MSVNPAGSSSLLGLFAAAQANQSTSSSTSPTTSATDILAQLSNDQSSAFSSLLSETDSSSSSNDSLLTALTSVSSSSVSMLKSLQSSNSYAQLIQSAVSGSADNSASSIFGGLDSTPAVLDSNSALLTALGSSGMSSSQITSVYNEVSAMSSGASQAASTSASS